VPILSEFVAGKFAESVPDPDLDQEKKMKKIFSQNVFF